jgi:hypothetical protein
MESINEHYKRTEWKNNLIFNFINIVLRKYCIGKFNNIGKEPLLKFITKYPRYVTFGDCTFWRIAGSRFGIVDKIVNPVHQTYGLCYISHWFVCQ